jgi:RNA polymerase sigma factor (sigma-70 family)
MAMALGIARASKARNPKIDPHDLESWAMHGVWSGIAGWAANGAVEGDEGRYVYNGIRWVMKGYLKSERDKSKRRVLDNFRVSYASQLLSNDESSNSLPSDYTKLSRIDQSDPLSLLLADELFDIVCSVLRDKSEKLLFVFRLLFEEEWSIQETAKYLGVSRQTVLNYRSKIIEILKNSDRVRGFRDGLTLHDPRCKSTVHVCSLEIPNEYAGRSCPCIIKGCNRLAKFRGRCDKCLNLRNAPSMYSGIDCVLNDAD